MIIHSIRAENYRPFAVLEEVRLGLLATIVGQNDAGKSSILQAIKLFFDNKPRIDQSDVHVGASPDDAVVVEVAFTSLPAGIELENGVETTLQEEKLVDAGGYLRIRKRFPRSDLSKCSLTLITQDLMDDQLAGLAAFNETKLNALLKSFGLDATKSGRGVTNKSKRQMLRSKAAEDGIPLGTRELPLAPRDDLCKRILALLPEFALFETDTKLGVGETTFQSQFRPIIKGAAEQPNVIEARESFTGAIATALQSEIAKIFRHLQKHTDAFIGLAAEPGFAWDKAVTFQILGRDQQGIENSLDQRGSGMRRLLMVAFFQYLAEKGREGGADYVFAIEEPENCLHPGLQRELAASFRRLAEEGYQVIITSHSPVFAGASPIEDLALVVRTAGVAEAIQTPDLDLPDVAEQLGVEPADQITEYHGCIFVEGPDDVEFWEAVATKLKETGRITANFDDRRIGFIIFGGDNLKHWINRRAMQRLNRNFAVVVDSDRKNRDQSVAGRKLAWKARCEKEGGTFFILRKREIENYLHPNAISRSGRNVVSYDDFTDMKKIFGNNVSKVITDMSCDEILEMDSYEANGVMRHELLEIVQSLLAVASGC